MIPSGPATFAISHAPRARKVSLPCSSPVAMDGRALDLSVEQQALRWDRWDPPHAARTARLTTDLTHEFCRMLRSLDTLRNGRWCRGGA